MPPKAVRQPKHANSDIMGRNANEGYDDFSDNL